MDACVWLCGAMLKSKGHFTVAAAVERLVLPEAFRLGEMRNLESGNRCCVAVAVAVWTVLSNWWQIGK
jgi:hypothetical protein